MTSPAAIEKAKLSRCVQCGLKRIVRRKEAVRLRSGKSVRVEAEVCLACGERHFDYEAMLTLEAAEQGRKNWRA